MTHKTPPQNDAPRQASIVDFLDTERLIAASRTVRIAPEAGRMPEEAAFHCLMRALGILGGAYPLTAAESERRAASFEYKTGGDQARAREMVAFIPNPSGAVRLGRLLVHVLELLVDFEPASYEGRPAGTPDALQDAMDALVQGMADARDRGVGPWQRARLLIEELEETLMELAGSTTLDE